MAWRVGRQGSRNTLKDNDCKRLKRIKSITVDSVRPVNTKYKFKKSQKLFKTKDQINKKHEVKKILSMTANTKLTVYLRKKKNES